MEIRNSESVIGKVTTRSCTSVTLDLPSILPLCALRLRLCLICRWTLGLLPPSGYVNNATVNMEVQNILNSKSLGGTNLDVELLDQMVTGALPV